MNIFKGMDNNQLYMTAWSLAFIAFMALITIVGILDVHEDSLIHDLVDKGHDPVELACLFNSSDSMKIPCVLLTQAKATVMTEK